MARYDLTRFLTTHNSYSGGGRGSLPAQLDGRIRCVEFDIHDSEWSSVRDFRLGHLKPGMEVWKGSGNPSTLVLTDWLATIASWSTANPGHGPITLVLDAKSDLTDNDDGGDLEDLNWILLGAFGQKLWTRADFDAAGAWPDLAAMQDRVVCVLSGDGHGRLAYRWAYGARPAIAVNDAGQVVLAYLSADAGDLRIWTGTLDANAGGVEWLRKLGYSPESPPIAEPVVAITDEGWIVLVYRYNEPGFPNQLAYHVGHLQSNAANDGRITWGRAKRFAAGTAPTLSIDGDEISEIHTSIDGKAERLLGTLDPQGKKIAWGKSKSTTAKRPAISVATHPAGDITCGVDAGGWIGSGFNGGVLRPVRFRQVVFVEVQGSEDPGPFRDAVFFAANAKDESQIASARSKGMVARAWVFEDGDRTNPWVENMPATNTPSDLLHPTDWYRQYMQGPDVGT